MVLTSFLLTIAAGLLWKVSRSIQPINLSMELQKELIEARLISGSIQIEHTSNWPSYEMLGTTKSMDFNLADIKKHWGVTIIPGHPVFYQIYSPTLEGLGVVRGGDMVTNGRARPTLNAIKYIFPAWYPLVLTSIPLAIYLLVQLTRASRRLIRIHRKRHGLCLNCGYDLRESKDRCPECGLTIARVTAAAKATPS